MAKCSCVLISGGWWKQSGRRLFSFILLATKTLTRTSSVSITSCLSAFDYVYTLTAKGGKSILTLYTVHHHQFVMFNLWWNVVIFFFPFCFNLPHQLLLQSVISQNGSNQLPENGVSQKKQPMNHRAVVCVSVYTLFKIFTTNSITHTTY